MDVLPIEQNQLKLSLQVTLYDHFTVYIISYIVPSYCLASCAVMVVIMVSWFRGHDCEFWPVIVIQTVFHNLSAWLIWFFLAQEDPDLTDCHSMTNWNKLQSYMSLSILGKCIIFLKFCRTKI
jgi:hypothetical protein